MLEVLLKPEAFESIIEIAVNKAVAAERQKIAETEIIDSDTMCKRFGITLSTLQKWRDRKEIPYIQIGNTFRYDYFKILQVKEVKRRR